MRRFASLAGCLHTLSVGSRLPALAAANCPPGIPPQPPSWLADDSKVLLSAAGDSSARLWSMEDGRELFRFRFNEPARACRFSVGEKLAAVSTDPFMNSVSTVRLFSIAAEPEEQSDEEVRRARRRNAGRLVGARAGRSCRGGLQAALTSRPKGGPPWRLPPTQVAATRRYPAPQPCRPSQPRPLPAPPAQVLRLTGPRGRITRLHWSDQNRVLLSSSEDGMVRRWDVETGKCLAEKQLHEKQVGWWLWVWWLAVWARLRRLSCCCRAPKVEPKGCAPFSEETRLRREGREGLAWLATVCSSRLSCLGWSRSPPAASRSWTCR